MRDKFVKTILSILKNNKDVIIITGDLGFGVLKPIWDKFPNQIINAGIAEQNMIGFAAGLSIQGKIVYVYSIGNFPTLRPLEQVRNDVAYHNLNVKIISVGAGFSYGPLGVTHHATEDLSIIRSLPNFKVYSPCDDNDVEYCIYKSYKDFGPCYIRLGRNSYELDFLSINYDTFNYREVNNLSNIGIMFHGDISYEIYELNKLFNKANLKPNLYFFHTIKPLKTQNINNILNKNKVLFIVEEHSKIGGLSSSIKELITDFTNIKIITLAINDKFTSKVGDQAYLRFLNKINAKAIYKTIIENLENYL